MQLNLRQARRLEREIETLIGAESTNVGQLASSANVSIYQDFNDVVNAIQTSVIAGLETIRFLNAARYDIRLAIQKQHATAGLNILMNEEASIKSMIAVIDRGDRHELTQVERDISFRRHQAAKASGTAQNEYGQLSDAITLRQTLEKKTLDVIKAQRKVLQRRLTAIADQLSGLNSTATIEINQAVADKLQDLGIEV